MAEIIYERTRTLMEAPLGDELVALDVSGGQCFGFNAVAASVWRMLAVPRSCQAVQTALMDEYEVGSDQCAQEVGELFADLRSRGLIRVLDGRPSR